MTQMEKFNKISKTVLNEIRGGASVSANCKWAIVTCAHDTILAGLGTSDPGSSCAYMRRVCKKN
ncbi:MULTISPECIES: hypothetical protein [Streptococcus]|uniref:hypothetical protein n=1 Tax=Streptococcus TaxID=1301 RepID=UPI000CF5A204|nr:MULTISPECIES: hypothetical protein [Streptococcus]MCG9877213.1 hypothetical protein [Streptococcus suis]MCL4936057.1 hypothetical protein [Streptococcus suis]BDD40862.1 hypothetical protein GUT184_11260 [Streptococcus ruminantium]HEM4762924.1 hypothetical protein [Streptococcus suis]HEM4887719.1 hypothetical protein [Streptococcus suis]